ncbi:hypothetical protein KBC86_05085, partial [Candidatus Gracilibacteria bacterium]|nr:hypothetical protein [Candidatus Gracilibacteria bacterium]
GILLSTTSVIMAMIMLVGESKKTNILWAAVCASMTFLGVSMFMIGTTKDALEALIWWKVAYVGVIMVPVLVTHTVLSVLKKDEGRLLFFLYILYAITFAFQIINASGHLIINTTYVFSEFYYDMPMTSLFAGFFLYFNLIFGYVFLKLFREYFHERDRNYNLATQIWYLGVGIGFGAIGGYSLYLPIFGFMIYPYASILMMFYPIIIGYAILHHHLFDARYAIMRVLRVIFILGLTALFGYILIGFYNSIFEKGFTFRIFEFLLIFLIFLFGNILIRSRKISSYFLLSSLQELEREVSIFLSKKGVYKNTLELLRDLELFFERGLKINRVSILQSSIARKYKHTSKYFQKYRRPLILSELETELVEGGTKELIDEVRAMGRMIFPIEIGSKSDLLFLVIGPKLTGQKITESEVMMILRILPKIAMALQILKFNQSLQAEVKRKTHSLDEKNRELKDAYEKLKEIDNNKDNFLAIASHELRTPMTIIKGYADLFLQNTLGPMTENQSRYMKKIFESTEGLIELVNNILDISKIEAGRMEVKIGKVVIRDVVHTSLEGFYKICEEKGIVIELEDNLQVEEMNTDEQKFRLILTNLLSNAYKFTQTGGVIRVSLSNTKKLLTISITDNGIGISEDRLPYIFEKFNQSENVDYTKKSIKGTGLGLNLSKQVVEMLDGSIEARSTSGSGSTFTFFLPL